MSEGAEYAAVDWFFTIMNQLHQDYLKQREQRMQGSWMTFAEREALSRPEPDDYAEAWGRKPPDAQAYEKRVAEETRADRAALIDHLFSDEREAAAAYPAPIRERLPVSPRQPEADLDREPPKPELSQLIHQKYWWLSKTRGWVKVKEMEPEHALFLAAMLLRQAPTHEQRPRIADLVTPVEWMQQQPLFKAIVKQGRKGSAS